MIHSMQTNCGVFLFFLYFFSVVFLCWCGSSQDLGVFFSLFFLCRVVVFVWLISGPRLWIDNLDAAEGTLDHFKSYFGDASILKCWHNLGFDRHILFNHGINVQVRDIPHSKTHAVRHTTLTVPHRNLSFVLRQSIRSSSYLHFTSFLFLSSLTSRLSLFLSLSTVSTHSSSYLHFISFLSPLSSRLSLFLSLSSVLCP